MDIEAATGKEIDISKHPHRVALRCVLILLEVRLIHNSMFLLDWYTKTYNQRGWTFPDAHLRSISDLATYDLGPGLRRKG